MKIAKGHRSLVNCLPFSNIRRFLGISPKISTMFQQKKQDTLHPKKIRHPLAKHGFSGTESLQFAGLHWTCSLWSKKSWYKKYVMLSASSWQPWILGTVKFLRYILVGGFNYFLFAPQKLGKMIKFDEHIFQMGWFNHQLALFSLAGNDVKHPLRLFVPNFFSCVFHHSVSPSFSGIPYIFRHGRIIPPNHTRESYPESYPRIIPPNHTAE